MSDLRELQESLESIDKNLEAIIAERDALRLRVEKLEGALKKIIRGWKDPYDCQECGGTVIAKAALEGK